MLAGSVRELQFDAMKLVSGSRDCTIRVFDLTRLEEFADEGERPLQFPANSLRNILTVVCRTVGTEHTAEQELPHFVVGVPGGTQHADRVRSIHCSSRRIVSGGTLPRAPHEQLISFVNSSSPCSGDSQRQDRQDLVFPRRRMSERRCCALRPPCGSAA